mmetsp:Transcript_6463/g.19610  ORF Transcript_6463/g.19610 Transcript_6463/m.19610 type:complete len:118 (+) Transcript_6463:675-1028(+)
MRTVQDRLRIRNLRLRRARRFPHVHLLQKLYRAPETAPLPRRRQASPNQRDKVPMNRVKGPNQRPRAPARRKKQVRRRKFGPWAPSALGKLVVLFLIHSENFPVWVAGGKINMRCTY